MKLLKRLLISVIVLAVLVGGTIAAAFILLSDDQTAGFKYDETPMVIENELANDIDASFKKIKETNYETNEITIDLTMGQLNSFIVSVAQDKLNPDYLKDEQHQSLYENGGFRVDSVYFASEGENIKLVACIGYKNVIKSAASVSVSVSVKEGNQLVIELSTIKVGKYINLNAGQIKSLLDNFKQYLSNGNIDGLDLENMTYTIDLNKVVYEALSSNPFIRDMFCALNYGARIEDGMIKLSVDTTKIFTGPRTKPSDEEFPKPDLTTLMTEYTTNGFVTIEMTEPQFNNIAYDDLNATIGSFAPSFDLGEKTFTLTCSDPWYNFNAGQVETNFSVNEVESTAAFIAEMKAELDTNDYVSTLSVHAELASVGNLKFGEMDSASGFVYDFNVEPATIIEALDLPAAIASSAKIKDFQIVKDETNPKVSFKVCNSL
ncbi:MAG: hypothetical protein MJ241_05805 [Bacilli bacterium]|nr:hypothetical protein [Bacilli bacterium]